MVEIGRNWDIFGFKLPSFTFSRRSQKIIAIESIAHHVQSQDDDLPKTYENIINEDICTVQDIVEVISEPACLLNLNGEICQYNSKFTKLLRLHPHSNVINISSYLTETSQEDFHITLKQALSYDISMRLPVHIDLDIPSMSRVDKVRINNFEWDIQCLGSRKALLLVARDTNSRESARNIRRKEQNLAKDNIVQYQQYLTSKRMFTRCVCHEVRTPLSVILSGLYLLESLSKEPENHHHMLEALEDSKLSCQSAMDVMKALTIYEELERRTFKINPISTDIAHIVHENLQCFHSAAKQWDITITLELTMNEQLLVNIDIEEFGFAIRALIDNAVKFIPNGGYVTLQLTTFTTLQDFNTNRNSSIKSMSNTSIQEWVRISVKDNGPGMSTDMQLSFLEDIRQFTPSTNETEQGRGVAICVVHGVAELHSGKLGMTSPGIGKGSTYYIDLPILERKEYITPLLQEYTVINQGKSHVQPPTIKRKRNTISKFRTMIRLGLFSKIRRNSTVDVPCDDDDGGVIAGEPTRSSRNRTKTKALPDHLVKFRIAMKMGLFKNYRRFDQASASMKLCTSPNDDQELQDVVDTCPIPTSTLTLPTTNHTFIPIYDDKQHLSPHDPLMGALEQGSIAHTIRGQMTADRHNTGNEEGARNLKHTELQPLLENRELSIDNLRLLIVDDVATCRKMLSRLLIFDNCICDEAKDGEDAVEKVRVAMSEGFVYDGIFMDDSMPRMTGPHAARAIRALGYRNKIFGVTGNSLTEDVDAFLSHGADKVVIKPLRREDIDLLLQDIRMDS